MRTFKNLLIHELIGLRVKIVNSSSIYLLNIEGIVVDESKNTLIIEQKGKEIVIPKKSCTFLFYLDNDEVIIEGKKILYRPEERVKKILK